jgi:CRP/FNR family transcriptional regulator
MSTAGPAAEVAAYIERWTRQGLAPSTGRALGAAATVRRVRARATLISPGETDDALLILGGYLAVRVGDADGHQFILTLARRGQTLVPPIARPPLIAGVEIAAVTTTVAALVPSRLVWDLAERDPAFALRLLDLSRGVVERLLSRLQELAFSSARQRLAVVLLAYEPLFAATTPILARTELAGLIGVSREMTSRLLRELERDGLISRSGRAIALTDPDGLRRLAHWDDVGRDQYRELRGPAGDDPLLDA